VPDRQAEDLLVQRLLDCQRNEEQITLVLGSGIGKNATPRVADVLRLAEQYATGLSDGGNLTRALAQARGRVGERSPVETYAAYRQAFAAWVASDEFDVIAQQAVLEMYRPPDRMATPLATHGIWQRVDRELGEALENDVGSWQFSAAAEALGATLAGLPNLFDNRIITTNFDPLLEVVIRIADGRAVSTPLDSAGRYDRTAGYDGAIRVFHVHGFWRPAGVATEGSSLIHDPARFAGKRAIPPIAELVTGDTVCVLGTSDWAGTISGALAEVARQRRITVLWASHAADDEAAARRRDQLVSEGVERVEGFAGIDSERLLTLLAERLHVTVTRRTAAGPRHRVRHPIWEREVVSQPDSMPPRAIPSLLRQLERRFAWKFQPASSGIPDLIFWPVRVREQASVIHMAQALAAGALAARGARLVVSLDDFGIWDAETSRGVFRSALARWIRHTGPGVDPEFVSLSTFVAEQRAAPSPEHLLRPVDPWSVAQDFYGEHNPSLYSVLAAIKAVPNVALHDLEEHSWQIVQALLRRNANRLLTPMTMWSLLHHLLLSNPTASIVTLGGRDEALFWEQWREVYRFGISQLYNPYIQNLSNKSGMLRWPSQEELRASLTGACALPGWDTPGSYLPWLFQNAFMLPLYLTHEPPPETGGYPLDSWAAFVAALDAGLPALDVLAEHASRLYLGGPA
jgi:hypothetical protein